MPTEQQTMNRAVVDFLEHLRIVVDDADFAMDVRREIERIRDSGADERLEGRDADEPRAPPLTTEDAVVTHQQELSLGPGSGDPMPPANWRDTSREAARRIAEDASRLQRPYMDALRRAGDAGLTDHEASREIGCALTTIQPRRAELNDLAGPPLVVESENRRPSPTGRPCIAWRLSSHGERVADL